MEHGKQTMVLAKFDQNPIKQLQLKYKEFEDVCKSWLAKQSLPVEVAIVSIGAAVQGGALGAIMGKLTADISSAVPNPPAASINPQAMASLNQTQALSGGPFVQARNFAVMSATGAGISSLMRRLRGKDDIQTSMAAAFGSGAMFSLVSGSGGPNSVPNAITSGLFFALVQGGIFKIGERFSQPPGEDMRYARTRSMLNNLGLQNYERNFKQGLLTDPTLPLLTDSALKDVQIPPGPRLVILDHIQRDPELSTANRT